MEVIKASVAATQKGSPLLAVGDVLIDWITAVDEYGINKRPS
jgi:hypothetical protein